MNSITIGKTIKNKRLSLNMRMDDLAREAGITRQTLGSIENGSDNYSFASLLKVINCLGLSLDINSEDINKTDRDRASRTNTKMDKKINRFLVFCIEQYANSVNKPSYEIYSKMKQKNIVNLIKDDYEDLHGMSTMYLNDYIGALLGEHE